MVCDYDFNLIVFLLCRRQDETKSNESNSVPRRHNSSDQHKSIEEDDKTIEFRSIPLMKLSSEGIFIIFLHFNVWNTSPIKKEDQIYSCFSHFQRLYRGF